VKIHAQIAADAVHFFRVVFARNAFSISQDPSQVSMAATVRADRRWL